MDLKDLKSAWDTYSSQEVDKHRLGKETIHELLKNRTKTLVDRIDRNIWIGIAVFGAFIIYILLDYFFLNPYLSQIIIPKDIEYPKWLDPLDVFSTVLIVTTYLFFVFRYLRVRRSFLADTQLKDLLIGILDTVKTYQRMFYLAVIILLINVAVSFATGFYQGVKLQAGIVSGGIENLTTTKILVLIVVCLVFLSLIVALLFLLLRWGFNKLYGRYLVKLNETLHELDESATEE
jgi:hypothetical protein